VWPWSPAGPLTRSNSSFNGAAPRRARALVIDPVVGVSQPPQPRPPTAWASASLLITNPYPERMNSQQDSTKITTSRAGSRR
jgi:hypothetical protein